MDGMETENNYYIQAPKQILPGKPRIQWKLTGDDLELISDKLAMGVELQLPEGVEPSDNYFDLVPGIKKTIRLGGNFNASLLTKDLRIRSLADTY
jgi:hypothetical protein